MARRRFKRLVFEYEWDERDEFETPKRGYRDHVLIEFEDGSYQRVTFFDSVRLFQSINAECDSRRPFFAEQGLIVVPEVTRANMETAARLLTEEGFFDPEPDLMRKNLE